MKKDMRSALRITSAMVGLPFGIVPLHHDKRSLSGVPRACSLALLLVTFAAFSCLAQTSDTSAQTAPSTTPAADASTPAAQTTTPPADTTTPAAPAAAPPAAAAAAAPAPLPTPSMAGPLATAIPHEIAAGPFGKVEVTGILSGFGWSEGNAVAGDPDSHWDVSNAQIFIQKTTGWFQFYLQGGAYNIPALGTPFLSTGDTVRHLYGPFPQGFAKLVKGNFNVEIGALPTLIGAEYTFDFENMNINRGLLWNQENAVNRGVQLNYTHKKLALAFSWNDGFYSNRYTWLTGSLTYTFNAANTLSFVGGGNAGAYAKNTLATPLFLNNEAIYNIIYTYTKGHWVINPYYQYSNVPTNANLGITQGASTSGGALLLTYAFKHGISLAVRPEYIKSNGSVSNGAINLLYGPGSGAFSFSVTPTYIKDGFFARAEFSIVHATSSTAGFAFGSSGVDTNQPRGTLEAGFMF